jgi:hypothetical protein
MKVSSKRLSTMPPCRLMNPALMTCLEQDAPLNPRTNPDQQFAGRYNPNSCYYWSSVCWNVGNRAQTLHSSPLSCGLEPR